MLNNCRRQISLKKTLTCKFWQRYFLSVSQGGSSSPNMTAKWSIKLNNKKNKKQKQMRFWTFYSLSWRGLPKTIQTDSILKRHQIKLQTKRGWRRGVYQVFSQKAEMKSLCWCSGYRKRTGQCRRPCSSWYTWAPVTSLELRPSRLSCDMAAEEASSSSSLSEPCWWGLADWRSLMPLSCVSQKKKKKNTNQWANTSWDCEGLVQFLNKTLTFTAAKRASLSLCNFFSLALAFLASLSAALWGTKKETERYVWNFSPHSKDWSQRLYLVFICCCSQLQQLLVSRMGLEALVAPPHGLCKGT